MTAVKLAAFFVVCAAVTAYLAAVIGDLSFESRARYAAIFEDVSGLRSGDPVRIAGVQVGKVDEVAIHDGDQVRITFEIDESLELSSETRLAVRYKNLIGDRYLELSRGLVGTDRVEPGETLPAANTTPALDLDTLLNGFQPLFEGLNSAEINALSTDIVQTLQGEGGTIESILTHVASLTGSLSDRDQVVGEVITNLRRFLDVVVRNQSDLDSLIVNLQELITGLDSERRVIGSVIQRTAELGDTAADLLTQLRPDVRSDIASLGAVTDTLLRRRDTLSLVLDKLPDTYARLARFGSYGNFFNFYVCALRFKVDGPNGPTFTRYMTNKADRCLG